MDTSRLEELFEQLLAKQDELIARIAILEDTIEQGLGDANTAISEIQNTSSAINDELNWWGENPSLAKQILQALNDIESAARR